MGRCWWYRQNFFGGLLSLIAMFRGQRDYAYVPAIAVGFVLYIGVITLF